MFRMDNKRSDSFKIRPYARLLTMLGDQLIKNEIVALTELIKNSYDADADNCYIAFENFNDLYVTQPDSKIIISDDGFGMSKYIITTHFLNPATPIKKTDQYTDYLYKSKKNRITQGEKGVGRFSMLKLGRKITVFSKQIDNDDIHKIVFDFGGFDDELIFKDGSNDELYLDQLDFDYQLGSVQELPDNCTIKKAGHGTIIVIEQLKGVWGNDQILELKNELIKFNPLEINNEAIVTNRDFNIVIIHNGKEDPYYDESINRLKALIDNKALYKITGDYDERNKKLKFSYIEANAQKKHVSVYLYTNKDNLNDFEIKLYGLSYYKKEIKPFFDDNTTTECGPFSFEFYIFDFEANTANDYGLKREEKEIIRNHRIFLYRDDVRVQPYGAPDDDWLQIDRKRANARANEMFSNDQLIGQIKITKEKNHNLRDKTSREGIIEDGKAFVQLTAIIRTFLSLIRTKLYQNYKAKLIKQKRFEQEITRSTQLNSINVLEKILHDNKEGLKQLSILNKSFSAQSKSYDERLRIVESLAGVGLSVEASSHDLMLAIGRLKETIYDLRTVVNKNNKALEIETDLNDDFNKAEQLISLIDSRMKNLQAFFVSSKQKVRQIKVEPLIDKVKAIYEKQYKRQSISVEYRHLGKKSVTAKIIDAVIYQVFINLFDNSLYWLQLKEKDRKVVIVFEGERNQILFCDTGYGVQIDDAPYIFEAFYSGKGEEGRGLGLYIARRLLNRYGYSIELINDDGKIECGANFRIDFNTSGDQL